MEPANETAGKARARGDMVAESRRIIDAARERGLTLRLLGGLGVRAQCRRLDLCERDYSDIDVAGRRRDDTRITALFRQLGYTENVHVRQATRGRQLQFSRQCAHPDDEHGRYVHPDDHVDVFLDSFRMDHDVPLQRRLHTDGYTLPLSDLLLTKLQAARVSWKDVQDVFTILRETDVAGEDGRGRIDASYIGRLCARDWGMHHDVLAAIRLCEEALAESATVEGRERVLLGLRRLREAMQREPKTLTWRLRARIGERMRWNNPVEEQSGEDEGGPFGAG